MARRGCVVSHNIRLVSFVVRLPGSVGDAASAGKRKGTKTRRHVSLDSRSCGDANSAGCGGYSAGLTRKRSPLVQYVQRDTCAAATERESGAVAKKTGRSFAERPAAAGVWGTTTHIVVCSAAATNREMRARAAFLLLGLLPPGRLFPTQIPRTQSARLFLRGPCCGCCVRAHFSSSTSDTAPGRSPQFYRCSVAVCSICLSFSRTARAAI